MIRIGAICFVVLLLSAACVCRQKATVFLLPDDQGKTGSIVVSGTGGERVLSEPLQSVNVSAGAAPGKPFVLTDKEVRAQVGPALDALPTRPLQFLLYFHHDSDELTKESIEKLPEVLRSIRERGPVDISVVGHTDTVGDKAYNHQLSLRRARAVAALLTGKGVDPNSLDITSHGKDNPLVPTGDQVPEPRNRRVEVTVR